MKNSVLKITANTIMNLYKTPDGTRDLLFYDGKLRGYIEGVLRNLYRSYGYSEVKTPIIEHFDLYASGQGAIPQTGMFTSSASDGRLVALRADSTKPIARLFSAHRDEWVLPVRFFYSQSVVRRGKTHYKQRVERYQAGIELIDNQRGDSFSADVEALSLAAAGLKALFGENFRIEIGHSSLLGSPLSSLGLPDDRLRLIRSLVAEKAYPRLEEILRTLPPNSSDAQRVVRELPRLFGGEEVLDRYETLVGARSEETAYLRRLLEEMRELGYEKNVLLDLATQNEYGYYTGIMFKGFALGGSEVLSGGRYDSLYRDFGLDMSAIGFAVDADEIAASFASDPPSLPNRRSVVVYSERGIADAVKYIAENARENIKYELALGSFSEAAELAKKRGAELIALRRE